MNYYNEIDPYCVQWLKNLIAAGLIPEGDVDDRDIKLVRPSDLVGYAQCHFFAGIGGWSYALGLAGWPEDRPVWTGSCPCQPFSHAGQRKGFDDKRHLWPAWFPLIRECRPPIVFGEQVASAKLWLDVVSADMEALGYAFGAAVLPAASVGAPHRRDRWWFVADTGCVSGRSVRAEPHADQSGTQFYNQRLRSDVADANEQPLGRLAEPREKRGFWDVEPDVGRVANGVPARVVKLRALGNTIVAQVAAEFIGAYLDVAP